MGRPAVFGAADASERASEMFLRTGAFFSSILSEFLKNLVALHRMAEMQASLDLLNQKIDRYEQGMMTAEQQLRRLHAEREGA